MFKVEGQLSEEGGWIMCTSLREGGKRLEAGLKKGNEHVLEKGNEHL